MMKSFFLSIALTLFLIGCAEDSLNQSYTKELLDEEQTPVAEMSAPMANADFDNNGRVDGLDFLAWQRGLGKSIENGNPALPQDGDADGDFDVDGDDLSIWQSEFGFQQ